MKLVSEQLTFFYNRGYLRLEQAVARDQLRPLQTRIADNLQRHGIGPSGRGMPRSIRELPVFQQIARLSQLAVVPDFAANLIPRDVTAAIEDLAKRRVASLQGQLLLSPPTQGDWSLDGLNWHTDLSSPPRAEIPGIQAFVILRDLKTRGGATLALTGSQHHIGNGPVIARIRAALRAGPVGESTLRELGLSVVEFAGRVGDVYLMDMRLLHTPSVNASNQLRMVATVRFFFA